MLFGTFLLHTPAVTAFDLKRKTRACAFFQPKRFGTQVLVFHQLREKRTRTATRIKKSHILGKSRQIKLFEQDIARFATDCIKLQAHRFGFFAQLGVVGGRGFVFHFKAFQADDADVAGSCFPNLCLPQLHK